MKKPISNKAHGLIDYALGAFSIAAPMLLRLSGPTAHLARSFGASQMGMSAVTDHPTAVKPMVKPRMHRKMELMSGPTMAALAVLLGGYKSRRNLMFIIGQTLLATAIYQLTDWRDPNHAKPMGRWGKFRRALMRA